MQCHGVFSSAARCTFDTNPWLDKNAFSATEKNRTDINDSRSVGRRTVRVGHDETIYIVCHNIVCARSRPSPRPDVNNNRRTSCHRLRSRFRGSSRSFILHSSRSVLRPNRLSVCIYVMSVADPEIPERSVLISKKWEKDLQLIHIYIYKFAGGKRPPP